MRVLMIDDEPESLDPLLNELAERTGYECQICGFADSSEWLRKYRPAAVVLDLLGQRTGASTELLGDQAFNQIWQARFCPILVYSARPEELDDVLHPFVKKVQKGGGSEVQAANLLAEFRPHCEALAGASDELDKVLHQSLRDVATALPPGTRAQVLMRVVHRQVAARLDLERSRGAPLESWEQYLYPSPGSDLLTGDVLRLTAEDTQDPLSFRLVLSPSCDLVCSGGRAPKAASVLAAKCLPLSELSNLLSLSKRREKAKQKLVGVLRRGFSEGHLPLPGFTSLIPPMVANLRDLELIEHAEIGAGEASKRYTRVASIDSPFRELVAWAYLQIAARPGLPDRDAESWSDELLDALWSTGASE